MAQEKEKRPFNPLRNWWWIYILIFAIIAAQYWIWGINTPKETTWNDFRYEMLEKDQVESLVVVNDDRVEIHLKPEAAGEDKSGPQYFMNIGSPESFEDKLAKAEAELGQQPAPVRYEKRSNWLANIIGWTVPLILIMAIWFFLLRRATNQNAGGVNPMDFGKSGAKLFEENDKGPSVNFDDVAGLEEAKVEIREVVEFLKNPGQYTRLGAKIPKGILLVGPPGTGKTLLAKAVAGEAKVPFFSISGSEFVEMFVGVGASRVRDLFRKAKEKAPSIIFIDEIDAIGRTRMKAFSMQTNDERESTLNQLLTELDGFGTNSGVIVLAATNRADVLDRALLRPGRFDRHIYLELPNLVERKAIFGVHLRPLVLGQDVDADLLAAQTPGFSGADIANICNEAALIAARRNKQAVDRQDFMDATDRVIAGLEKKSKIISKEEKKVIAYHEAGHATASWFLEYADPLIKVSIVPRGKALGAAWYLPEEHQIYTTRQFMDRICTALAGRASEDLFFNEVSSGALDDLEKVTKLAYTMVAFYGLNKRIGNLSFFDSSGEYEHSFQKPYSEETARVIDEEVHKLVEQAYERTKQILKDHQQQLETLAKLLLEKEVVLQEDLEAIFGKRKNQ